MENPPNREDLEKSLIQISDKLNTANNLFSSSLSSKIIKKDILKDIKNMTSENSTQKAKERRTKSKSSYLTLRNFII